MLRKKSSGGVTDGIAAHIRASAHSMCAKRSRTKLAVIILTSSTRYRTSAPPSLDDARDALSPVERAAAGREDTAASGAERGVVFFVVSGGASLAFIINAR